MLWEERCWSLKFHEHKKCTRTKINKKQNFITFLLTARIQIHDICTAWLPKKQYCNSVSAGTHGLVAYNLLQSYDQLLHEYWYIIVSCCIISFKDKQTSRQIHHIHIIVVTDSNFLFKDTWCNSFITAHTVEYHNHSPSCLNF